MYHSVTRKSFLTRKLGVNIFTINSAAISITNNRTKRLFSEDYLNSKLAEGRIDHLTLEYELKALFEDDFSVQVKKIQSFIKSQEDMRGGYEALCWLMLLGLLGDLRHPGL